MTLNYGQGSAGLKLMVVEVVKKAFIDAVTFKISLEPSNEPSLIPSF